MIKRVFVLVSLVVAVLIGIGNAFEQGKTSKSSIPEPSLGPEWKLVGRDSHGTTIYVNTRSITHLPKSIVIWTLQVPRGKDRRGWVSLLKLIFSLQEKDPTNAERLWYGIELDKFNCKKHQVAPLEGVDYSFGQTVLDDDSFQHEEWGSIAPGSTYELIENYVCK